MLKRLRRDRTDDAGQRLADEIRFCRELGAVLPVRAPRCYHGVTDPDNLLSVMENVEGVEHPSDPWEAYRLGVLAWMVRGVHFMRPFSAGETPEIGPGQMVLERCAAAPVELGVGDLIL